MKKLNPDGSITIPSNLPRTHLGLDSRGYRICIAQIGRSCSTDTGFVTFTDGSAYIYLPPSKDEFEALCASVHRGRQFNFQVRRSRSGYVRGFTPPADYEVIYNFPPYAGSVPAACPLPSPGWPNLTWTTSTSADDTIDLLQWVPASGDASVIEFDMANSVTFPNWTGNADGLTTYNGPAAPGAFAMDATTVLGAGGAFWTVFVIQDGSVLLFQHFGGGAPASFPGTFMFNDTAGLDSVIEVQIGLASFPSFPPCDMTFIGSAS